MTIACSQIFQQFERAFTEITGMPLTLSPAGDWHLAHHGHRRENPFCAMMAQSNKTCSACLIAQQRISNPKSQRSSTTTCYAGLRETAVPLRVGENLIGFLRTGEVIVGRRGRQGFNRILHRLQGAVDELDTRKLKTAWLKSRVLSANQYTAAVRMLEVFAEHLSLVINQLILQQENGDSPVIAKAKQFITEHQTEELSLGTVARSVNMSSFYFCKTFKKATGINFIDYLSRIRIERAKNLLLNPNVRITEVAFESGFSSITNFNRIFKRHAGRSPSDYRETLLHSS